MCWNERPLGLTLLHALRLYGHLGDRHARAWLDENALHPVAPSLRELAHRLKGTDHLAPPGSLRKRPQEQALLEALAHVDRDPDHAERRVAFLPLDQRQALIAALSEANRRLSNALNDRLRASTPAPQKVFAAAGGSPP
jgi:hypothetical protein